MKQKKSILCLLFALFAWMSVSCTDNASLPEIDNNKSDATLVQGQPYNWGKSTLSPIPEKTLASLRDGDPNFSMDDIEYWVGNGSKQAALVIEWHDGKSPDALVWGYRWDGDAHGIDMLRAIVKADKRLIFLTHMTQYGNTIAGLGYDINKTGKHYLIYKDSKFMPTDGVVETDAYNYDDWSYSDSEDHWLSGWYKGYWSYWVKDSFNEDWSYSNWGASSRVLKDGSWDGWSFLDDMSNWSGRPLGSKFVPASAN
ncbi:hypothetical protein QYZ87_06965 [Porphyromonadaceae bacterium W3.11]|nr:hypothetical protein [Porphyromonadaceae bacterium W3.11]